MRPRGADRTALATLPTVPASVAGTIPLDPAGEGTDRGREPRAGDGHRGGDPPPRPAAHCRDGWLMTSSQIIATVLIGLSLLDRWVIPTSPAGSPNHPICWSR